MITGAMVSAAVSSQKAKEHKMIPGIHPYIQFYDNGSRVKAHPSHPRAAARGKHPKPKPPTNTWTIPALAEAYQCPTNLAGGGKIGIVELGGGWTQADVTKAFQAMGLPPPNITDVSVDGTTTNAPGKSDADGEVALDIQVAAGIYSFCTGKPANITMFWAQDIGQAVAAAAAAGCTVCSISWGSDESNWGVTALEAMEATAKAAVAKGMTVFAAAGDNDSSDGGPTPANVDGPGSCPSVISCGGTNKPQVGAETVWNNNPENPDGSGTGGGYSTVFPVQPWQTGAPPPPAGLGRMVPDVAADADPSTGYDIVVNGQSQVVGGTSAVAPLYAGLVAAIVGGKGRGFITPALYQNSSDFTDVTSGDNGMFSAGPGPDPCTGLGSPLGTRLAATISSLAGV
jgi:kumamolisin